MQGLIGPMDSLQTRWIWPFKLDEKIGEGGMGVVYRARYAKNDREVAVKLLPADGAVDPTVLARFEREMEVLKGLRHPHIVHCFGGVCEDDRRFYAMEYVDGGSIEGLVERRGRLPWEQVVEYGLQLSSALAFAHERGFVHRDIKPANLLLTRSGKLKLSDFGLAHVMAAHKLTAADRTVGTFSYMAPEQIRGKPEVSPKTDLYALGGVLFEMVTGRPPYLGESPASVLHQHLKSRPPSAAAEAPDCPVQLDHLIQHLLEKDPERRPESALAVGTELSRITQTSPASLTVVGPRAESFRNAAPAEEDHDRHAGRAAGVPRWLIGAGLGILCLLIGLLFWNWHLRKYEQFAEQTGALWLQAYRSENPSLRMEAARALGDFDLLADSTVPVLIEGLADRNAQVRVATAEALGRLEAAAKPAIPALMDLQKNDPEPHVRSAASQALKKIRSAESTGSSGIVGAVLLLLLALLGAALLLKRPRQNLSVHRRTAKR